MRNAASYQEGYTDGFDDARKKYEGLIDPEELKEQIKECKHFYRSGQKLTVMEFETIIYDIIDNMRGKEE